MVLHLHWASYGIALKNASLQQPAQRLAWHVAQFVERSPRLQRVVGSNPTQGSSSSCSCPGCSWLVCLAFLPRYQSCWDMHTESLVNEKVLTACAVFICYEPRIIIAEMLYVCTVCTPSIAPSMLNIQFTWGCRFTMYIYTNFSTSAETWTIIIQGSFFCFRCFVTSAGALELPISGKYSGHTCIILLWKFKGNVWEK